MRAGDEGKLRPEDLADLDMLSRRLETTDEHTVHDLRRRVRTGASRSGLNISIASEQALSMLLGVSVFEDEGRPGQGLRLAHKRLRAAFIPIGMVLGVLATTGILLYDGTRPVNVLTFLSALLAPQVLLLLLLFTSLVLGRRLESILPVLGWLRRAVSKMWERLAKRYGETSKSACNDEAQPLASAEESLYAGVNRWRSIALMQWLAVGFNIGIVLALLTRLAVTDVVFGWSTTLGAIAQLFPSLVELLSWPWATWLPAAAPDPSIVEATRYVRLGGLEVAWAGAPLEPDVLLFSGWWPFLLVSVLAYGLLPRLFVLALSLIMVRQNVRWAVTQSRRLERLHQRVSTPLIEVETEVFSTGYSGPDDDEPRDGKPSLSFGEEKRKAPDNEALDIGPCSVVLWGDVPDPKDLLDKALASRTGATVEERLKAGGLAFDETRQAIARLTTGRLSRLPVVLVAEAYEAPAEELERFLQAVRIGGRPERVVIVALVDVLEEEGFNEAKSDDEAMWRSGLRRLPGAGAHLLGPVLLPRSGSEQ